MAVVGAGVVGLACARRLQRAGRAVALVDPEPPGSGCSHGNAGVIAVDHVLPLARPEVLAHLPGMLLDRRGPLYLRASRVPRLTPWMIRFAAACRPARVERGTRALAALTRGALEAWQEELEAAGAAHLLCRRGMYVAYRSEKALRAHAAERAAQRHLGVRWEVLAPGELQRREPALSAELRHAVHYPEVAHVQNPAALSALLVERFRRDGGMLLAQEAVAFRSEPHQVVIRLRRGRLRSRYVVLAAGFGARRLCASLGLRVPLAAELGYHVAFAGAEDRLSAPVALAEPGFLLTPMADELRAAGTVELAATLPPVDWRRADALEQAARLALREALPAPAGRWRGARPSLPDSLPAIGPIPGHPRIVAAFGHQHVGLTTAAVTGALVCEMVQGERPELDMAPYDPGRFTFSRILRSTVR